MDIALIVAALAALISGSWRGMSVLVLAPVLAALAAFLAGSPVMAAYTQIFMRAAGNFIVSYFPLFLLGAVFGRILEDSGAARGLALGITRMIGPSRAILAVVMACAILTYGGVSLFVVAFAAWPLARALFAASGTPARLIPATIALGAFTFTMTALPGTPAIQNAIPMPIFGTDAFAAPLIGMLAALVMALGGLGWLGYRTRRIGPEIAVEAQMTDEETPGMAAAALPIASVVSLTWLASHFLWPSLDTGYLVEARYGATSVASLAGLWSVIAALCAGCLLALALGWRRLIRPSDTLNHGATAALLPMFNTASLVGFGAVVAALPGFEAMRLALDGLSGGEVLVSTAIAVNALAAITGSASGGLSIALETLGPGLLAEAQAEGIAPALLHRIATLATGCLDALPHNGAVVSLLGICGMTHREAYGDIFMVAVAIPVVALVAAIIAGLAFGAI